jgi:threonine dehydrogenase-like Zn-dependent dehydrogenase
MKAVTWHGKRDVRVEEVPDPVISEPTDAIVRITSSGLCGSDLHLYETLGPFMGEGDVLGHEPMGIVEEVGSATGDLKVGDRVVMPFQICCGSCWMCDQGLYTQCETTQVREQGTGAALFGFSKLYGEVPVGRPRPARSADYGPIKPQRHPTILRVPLTCPDRVAAVSTPHHGGWTVLGWVRSAAWRRASRCTAASRSSVSTWPERSSARGRGVDALDLRDSKDLTEAIRVRAEAGTDAVIGE